MSLKRILTLQDISCVGKCALTVALPIISAMGIEACPVPTALLSNHTAFDGYKIFDLTNQMEAIKSEFIKQAFTFDGIYTGYLGSLEQIETVSSFIDTFKEEGSVVLVDPVMGDNGKLYSGVHKDFPKRMRSLCQKADIIVPNVTEAGFLLGQNSALTYSSLEEIKSSLKELTDLGVDFCVLTGVELEGKCGACGYKKSTDEFYSFLMPKIQRTFHGTGDIFASILFSAVVRGASCEKALNLAVKFTFDSMQATVDNPDARWYGVDFETVLSRLCAAESDFT